LERIERIKADPLYQEYLLLNGLREKERAFCRHDFQHALAVSQISCKIIDDTGGMDGFARKEGLPGPGQALEVVYAAGLLHDIGRWRQYDTGEDHALAGARLSRTVLERAGFTQNEIKTVTRAIGEHRRAGAGASYLGRVVCLADDLSRPCGTCKARSDCYKFSYMENLREKNSAGYCLDVG